MGGREERLLGLFVVDFFERVLLADRSGADDRRPGIDGLEESSGIGERRQRIVGTLGHVRGAVGPSQGGDVGDPVGEPRNLPVFSAR